MFSENFAVFVELYVKMHTSALQCVCELMRQVHALMMEHGQQPERSIYIHSSMPTSVNLWLAF